MKKGETMPLKQRQKISKALTGHSVSAETRKKISQSNLGKIAPREAIEGRTARMLAKPDVETVCQDCGRTFLARRRTRMFCSSKCQKRYYKWRNESNITCDACGLPFFVFPYRLKRSKRFYCSYSCMAEGYRSDDYNLRDANTARQWRETVKQRDGYRCRLCGDKSELIAHHILPVQYFPEFLCDLDYGITVCNKHHWEMHKQVQQIVARIVRESEERLKREVMETILQ